MKYLRLLAVGLFLFGCTVPYAIDDRLSYKTAAQVKNELGTQKRLNIYVDEGLRRYMLAQSPSNYRGDGDTIVINVGEALGGYIDQLYKKVYTLEPTRNINVIIRMKESKADFKLSRHVNLGFKGFMLDYFFFDTTLEVDYVLANNVFSKTYRYNAQKELTIKEIDTAVKAKDTVIKVVLEDIAAKLIKDIVIETNNMR